MITEPRRTQLWYSSTPSRPVITYWPGKVH